MLHCASAAGADSIGCPVGPLPSSKKIPCLISASRKRTPGPKPPATRLSGDEFEASIKRSLESGREVGKALLNK